MPSSYHRRWRQHFLTALGWGSALLLAFIGPIGVAAAQTEAGEQSKELDHLRDVNADAARNADDLGPQAEDLQAQTTDRGLLLTLDDALFITNDIGLSSNGHRRLDALVGFLEQYPARSVAVDGYAGAGEYRYDQALSKRRADAVKTYLISRGVPARRLTARGNNDAAQSSADARGDQQPTRRVEVLIVDPFISAPQSNVPAPGT